MHVVKEGVLKGARVLDVCCKLRQASVYYSARYHLGTTSLRLGPFITYARYRLGTARALCYNARYRLGTARALYYNARHRLGTARALHYNARYRLGTARALYYNARYRLGTARALHYNARYRLGTARALYYNARYRLGTASVPLGPSITMRGTDTPFGFYKVLIGSEGGTSKKRQRPTESHETQP